MFTVTLSAKVYNAYQLKQVNDILRLMLKGLKVKTEILGATRRRWIQVSVSGEDEEVALHYLEKEIGLCPEDFAKLKRFSVIKGYVTALRKTGERIYVDAGIFKPDAIDVAIPLHRLQAQLVDGRKVALQKIIDLFGFCENLPLTVKVYSINRKDNHVEATLSGKQLAQYREWVKSLLDRLIVLGASASEVKQALKMAKCNRDVINIEQLGFFEWAVVCKLGTDAAGLIPKIGRKLRNANLTIFDPRKIISFTGNASLHF